jgi:anion-transporting  ArsA/GET3 family ATPase
VSGPALEAALASGRIAVCVGPGGVGKTTLAASLGLAAARRGRRACVVTIDPARRLADALGVGELGNEPRAIPRARLRRLGVPEDGALSATMLDMKRTFDGLVERFAPDAATRERIFQNPIYQHVSDALAGSAEYAAMEKVFELAEGGAFDLLVLDTPPSQHALDFLESPQRLLEFLDSRLVQILVHPAFAAGRVGFRLFQRPAQRVLRLVERVSGVAFLEDISEFLLAFEGMADGFRERARRVRSLLLGPEAAFVLAATPARESVSHALAFLEHLATTRVPLAAIVVNRVRSWPGPGGAPARVPFDGDVAGARARLADALAREGGPDFPAREAARAALDALAGYASLVRRDAECIAPLEARAAREGCALRRVPEFARDVHDLDALAGVADHLFAGEPRA